MALDIDPRTSDPLKPGDSDPFLDDAIRPSRLAPVPSFAELDVLQARGSVLIIPCEDAGDSYRLSSDESSDFRNEISVWLKALRDQKVVVTELLSVSARDRSVRQIMQELLDVAYRQSHKAWMSMIPTGRQLVLVPDDVLKTLGADAVCRVAHERSILAAKRQGDPFSLKAWDHYESLKALEH